jgi:hypothetical protein
MHYFCTSTFAKPTPYLTAHALITHSIRRSFDLRCRVQRVVVSTLCLRCRLWFGVLLHGALFKVGMGLGAAKIGTAAADQSIVMRQNVSVDTEAVVRPKGVCAKGVYAKGMYPKEVQKRVRQRGTERGTQMGTVRGVRQRDLNGASKSLREPYNHTSLVVAPFSIS